MLKGRVVKVREWLTVCVPFPVVYRVYGQLVTDIMPVISQQARDGEEGVCIGGPGGQQPEVLLPLPGD